MTRRKSSGLALVAAKIEWDLNELLEAWKEENGIVSTSEALRLLLRQALSEGGGAKKLGKDLKEGGYEEGKRQGAREIRLALGHLLKTNSPE